MPEQIKLRVQEYLDGTICGSSLVDYIDGLVYNDVVYDYNEKIQELILRYQDIFALYVEDPNKRIEHVSYYGPKKLLVFARDLKQELDDLDG